MKSFPAQRYYPIGHQSQSEIREILEQAVKPEGRVKPGSLLASINRQPPVTDKGFVVPEQVCNQTPFEPVNFE